MTRLRRQLLATVFVALLATVATGAAAARPSDGEWLTTRAAAAQKLPDRFRDIKKVACTPDRTSATQVFATTRYWNRFWCTGTTYDQLEFRLLFQAKGQCSDCWTVTHLSGLTSAHLEVRHAS